MQPNETENKTDGGHHPFALIKRVFRIFLGYFLAGVLAILPLVITVGVVVWVADLLGGFVGPDTTIGERLRLSGQHVVDNAILAYILGWVFVLAVIFGLGLLVEFGARRLIQGLFDAVMNRVPVINSIYSTSKQLTDMLKKKDEADLKGMRAVFCLFGKDNPTGLLALLTSPERFRINGVDYHAVIVPTAPVPVGGGLMFVPVENVIDADVSVDGLMSIYVSMGVTAPEYLTVNSKSTKTK